MGEYKVPQDVEAEDKIIGPLTLKQFMYLVIGLSWGAVSYFLFRPVPVFFVVLGLPVSALFLLLGAYKRQDQPFEKIFIALVGYLAKPRKRLWHKEQIEEVFHVEPAPVKAEPVVRNREETKSQLDKLVHVIESRGGAKSPHLQEPSSEAGVSASDRIFMPEHLEGSQDEAEAPVEVSVGDDVFDFQGNPTAHNLSRLLEAAARSARENAISKMHSTRGVKQTPSPSGKGGRPIQGAAGVQDDILKKALAESPLRVNQIAERASAIGGTGGKAGADEGKEGATVRLEDSGGAAQTR